MWIRRRAGEPWTPTRRQPIRAAAETAFPKRRRGHADPEASGAGVGDGEPPPARRCSHRDGLRKPGVAMWVRRGAGRYRGEAGSQVPCVCRSAKSRNFYPGI